MLWKCCTQYASKFGKLSSGHRTGKGQFPFQSPKKAMPKNAQATTQLHSSHTLVKWCLKFSKPGFSNTWTVNFQGHISSVQSLSRVRLFATPWIAARQASLSITNSWSLLKLMSINSVMPSNHLILCCPLLLPSIFHSIRVFFRVSVFCIRWQTGSSAFSETSLNIWKFTIHVLLKPGLENFEHCLTI